MSSSDQLFEIGEGDRRPEAEPQPKLSTDRRRTLRQKQALAKGSHPLSVWSKCPIPLHAEAAPVDDRQAEPYAIEKWEIANLSGGWFHPTHIHLVDFKILSRNGQAPYPYELGSKDVAYVGENETVRLITKFTHQTGRYMIHCHNLGHEDNFMLVRWDVGTTTSLVTSPFKDPAGTIPNTPGGGPGDPADPDHGAQPNPNPPILTEDIFREDRFKPRKAGKKGVVA
jgi:hypothetical protein